MLVLGSVVTNPLGNYVTYLLAAGTFENDVPFSQVGYVSFLERMFPGENVSIDIKKHELNKSL